MRSLDVIARGVVYLWQMFRQKLAAVTLVIAVIAVAACTGYKTSLPSNSALTGDWHGTTQDDLFGRGQLSFQLTQNGKNVIGKWSITFSAPQGNDAGNVSGTTSGTSVQMTFAPASPNPCMTNVTGSVMSGGDRMSGTYDNGNCPYQESGTFTASK